MIHTKINRPKNTFLSYLTLLILVFPTYMFPSWVARAFRYAKLISFVWAVIIFFKLKYYRLKELLPIILFLAAGAIATILNWNGITVFGNMFIGIFSSVVISYYYIQCREYEGIKQISLIFSLFLIINAITRINGGVLKPTTNLYGIVSYRLNYFLGTRVDISGLLIFAVSLSVIIAIQDTIKYKIIALLGIMAGVYFVLIESVSTAIMTLLVYVIVFIAARFIKSLRMWRNLSIFTLILVISFYFISMNMEMFSWLLVDFLGEGLTFNGRSYLWEQAINGIKGWHWLFGNGMRSNIYFTIGLSFVVSSAHSQYLNILFYFGILGLLSYVYFMWVQFSIVNKVRNQNIKSLLVAANIAIVIMGLPTTTFTDPYMFVYFICITQLSKYNAKLS